MTGSVRESAVTNGWQRTHGLDHSMRVLDLNCNQCGAPLEVPRKARFVTCAICNTPLQIQHEGAAVFTEALEEINEDLEQIKRNTELIRLDQEWAGSRENYVVRGKHGSSRIPTVQGSRMGMIGVIVFGGLWTLFASSLGAPGFFPLFGVFFVAFGIFASRQAMKKAQDYERDHAAYKASRRELMAE